MRTALRFAVLAAVLVSVAGCRFKGYEAFSKATTPGLGGGPYPTATHFGDPYGNGGTADASGGLKPNTRYGLGAQPGGKILPGYDEPSKGSGNQPGELPNVATEGHAQTNAPAFQPKPGSVSSTIH